MPAHHRPHSRCGGVSVNRIQPAILSKFFAAEGTPGYSVAAKVTWAVILVLCSALTCVQIWDRFERYRSEPVTVKVQSITNHTIEFPHVTLCNREPFRLSVLTELRREYIRRREGRTAPATSTTAEAGAVQIAVNQVSISDLIDEFGVEYMWKNATYNISEMLIECFFFRKKCVQYGKWKSIETVLGVCHTYQLARPTRITGPYSSLYIDFREDLDQTNETSRGWKLVVHHANEYPGVIVQTKGFTVYPDLRADIVLKLTQFQKANTKAKPCIENNNDYDPSFCIADCLYLSIAKQASCQLPHMKLDGFRVCNSSAEYLHATRLQERWLQSSEAWNVCRSDCIINCHHNIYHTKTDIRMWPHSTRTVARVYYEHLSYESLEESLRYGFVSFLSDVGGILGLYLGASMLLLTEILEYMLFLVKKYCVRLATRARLLKIRHN